ncbi:cell division protein [Phenylobacterium sp.]|uniref:cell division protein FtsL n=1 Tax=Phenylobacterium sp. TaxID=1871053 RepID=UPI0025E35396|nr:cell division protein [Phenylobacterium sp.]
MNPFTHRIRGFRLLDLVGVGVLVTIILGVYLAKTFAGRERADIAAAERQIDGEKARIRLLEAEVAHLEQPGRIERLSVAYLGLKPVSAKNEASLDQLAVIARNGPPQKAVAPSAVAALVDGAGSVPGVPPPPPAASAPVRLAEARPEIKP